MDIKERLVAAGVLPHIAAYVAAQRPYGWYNGGLFFFVVMVAGFAVGGLWIWPWLEGLTEANAHQAARVAGALLYYQNFGFGLVIGLFAWIFAAGVIVGALPTLSPRLMASSFCDAVLDTRSRRGRSSSAMLAQRGLEEMLKRQADQPDAASYVREATLFWIKPFVIAALVLTLISLAVLSREIGVHRVYTSEGYTQTHTLPVPPTSHAWSEATVLETGCNHVTGKNASDKPVYKVIFPDGSSVRLENATPLTGTWLDQMEVIDARIIASGPVIRPWRWLDRTPVQPDCLAAQRERLGDADYTRLLRLLHQ